MILHCSIELSAAHYISQVRVRMVIQIIFSNIKKHLCIRYSYSFFLLIDQWDDIHCNRNAYSFSWLYNLQQKVCPIHCSPRHASATTYIPIRQSPGSKAADLRGWSYNESPLTVRVREITKDLSGHYACNNKRHNIMFIAQCPSEAHRRHRPVVQPKPDL